MKHVRALPVLLVVGLILLLGSCDEDDPIEPAQQVTVTVNPTSGSTLGGTVVTVTLAGADMPSSATVTFDGTPAAEIQILNSSSATVTTPAHPAGFADVTVTAGGKTYTRADAFEFIAPPPPPPPVVGQVEPNSGPMEGGTTVTISGSGFQPGATVTFGGVAAASVFVNPPTLIIAKTPAGVAGAVAVEVTNPDGQSDVSSQAFSYIAPRPVVSSVTPVDGPGSGGTNVTIGGINFESGATVLFGDAAATSVTFVSATSMTAITPAGSGVVDVKVTNPDGQYNVLSQAFSYNAVVSSVTPGEGPGSGGTAVTISGSGFQAGATVLFGAAAATNVTFVSATSMTAITPAGSGVVDVSVTNPGGQSDVLSQAFSYSPVVSSVSPNAGALGGGTAVTIRGFGFRAGATVTFGGVPAASPAEGLPVSGSGPTATVEVVSSTMILATTPAGLLGRADVTVTNPDGQSGTLNSAFSYNAAPTISSISPVVGPVTGGTPTIIAGSNFEAGATVTFGGSAATGVVVNSTTSISATSPAGSVGAVDVVVTNPDGQSATVSGAFTYGSLINPAGPTSVTPNVGSVLGGTATTITGINFEAGATVTFGGVAATGVVVNSATSISATTPAGSAGAVNVVVTNPIGGPGTVTNGFTYMPLPTVTSVTPSVGPMAGGTATTIAGTNFEAGATVTFGGVAATGVVVNSATSISATTPAGAAGAVNVVVTNPIAGPGTGTNAFTYMPAPTITSVTPNAGPLVAGTATTIAGTNFEAGATVTFGGTAATGVVVNSATSISATSPAGSAGVVDVVVTNPIGGPGTATNGFTYMPPPTITSVTPIGGLAAGGTVTTIVGTNFEAGATVTFGGNAATGVVVNSATSISATSPAGALGSVDVVVTNPIGGAGSALTNGFEYVVMPSITTTSPMPNATFAVPYSRTLAASGGNGAYTWAMYNSTMLPTGLTLNPATGEISGTPTAAATFNFEVQVTSVALSADKPLAITVDPAPVIQNSSLLPVIVNLPYPGEVLIATGGDGTYAWAIGSGALPTGMTLNPTTGAITGTPTVLGTASFTVEVTSAGRTGSKALSIDVNPLREPAGFTAIVERPFNTMAVNDTDSGVGSLPNKTGGAEGWDGVESRYPNLSITSAPEDPLSPGNAMRITYPVGHPKASAPATFQTQGNLSALPGGPFVDFYVRTSLRLGPTYTVGNVSNKLYFHRTAAALRAEPFLALFPNGDGTFNLNVNFQGAPDNVFGFFRATGTGAKLRRNAFYVIETLLVMNSAQGVKDGVFRAWVNGELVIERTDVEYLRVENVTDEWGALHVSPTYGGESGLATNPTEFYFELGHAYVSGR